VGYDGLNDGLVAVAQVIEDSEPFLPDKDLLILHK